MRGYFIELSTIRFRNLEIENVSNLNTFSVDTKYLTLEYAVFIQCNLKCTYIPVTPVLHWERQRMWSYTRHIPDRIFRFLHTHQSIYTSSIHPTAVYRPTLKIRQQEGLGWSCTTSHALLQRRLQMYAGFLTVQNTII